MTGASVKEEDKALIISALQSAGYIAEWSDKYDCASAYKPGWKTTMFFNPLNDQGQAFQLAIELGMRVDIRIEEGVTFVELPSHNIAHGVSHTTLQAGPASLRAIVEVAARANPAPAKAVAT